MLSIRDETSTRTRDDTQKEMPSIFLLQQSGHKEDAVKTQTATDHEYCRGFRALLFAGIDEEVELQSSRGLLCCYKYCRTCNA